MGAEIIITKMKVGRHSISPPPTLFLLGGVQPSVPNYEKGGLEKNEYLVGLKDSCHGYFPGGLTTFLVKKRPLIIKYGFEGSISNVDLGLF